MYSSDLPYDFDSKLITLQYLVDFEFQSGVCAASMISGRRSVYFVVGNEDKFWVMSSRMAAFLQLETS